MLQIGEPDDLNREDHLPRQVNTQRTAPCRDLLPGFATQRFPSLSLCFSNLCQTTVVILARERELMYGCIAQMAADLGGEIVTTSFELPPDVAEVKDDIPPYGIQVHDRWETLRIDFNEKIFHRLPMRPPRDVNLDAVVFFCLVDG